MVVTAKTTDGDAGGDDRGKDVDDNGCNRYSDSMGHKQQSTKTPAKESAVAVAAAAAAVAAAVVAAETAEATA